MQLESVAMRMHTSNEVICYASNKLVSSPDCTREADGLSKNSGWVQDYKQTSVAVAPSEIM